MNDLHESTINCPYCGEILTILIDSSAGDQQYVEDCQVCCSPILFDIELNADGELHQISTRQENE